MERVRLERPGGKKQRLGMSWENPWYSITLIIGTFTVQFWTTNRAVRGTDHRTEWLILALISTLVGFSTFFAFAIYWYRKRLGEQRAILGEIEKDAIFTAPTSLGWIGLGENWIAISNPTCDVQRLDLNDFANFAWGYPSAKYLKHHPDAHFAIPNVLVKKTTGQHWIFVPSVSDPKKAIFTFFKKESEMLVWKEILDSVLAKKVPAPVPQPNKRDLARKSDLGFMVFLGCVFVILWILAIVAFMVENRDMGLIFTLFLGLSGFPTWGEKPNVRLIYRDVRLTIAGFDMNDVKLRDQLALSSDTLVCLTASNVGNTGVEEIPLSEIRKVMLEDWGESFVEKDVEKWFSKNAKSKHLVLRLFLDRADDPEREIRMPRDEAEKWYAKLNPLVG